jgi:hypothetical protein
MVPFYTPMDFHLQVKNMPENMTGVILPPWKWREG